MEVKIKESVLQNAAAEGMDSFLDCILCAIKEVYGDELTAETMQKLTADQITLWGYHILREELMDGGYVQLIHNGYGPFFFENPFAKAVRLWGLNDFSKQLYKARKIYETNKEAITDECSDEEFMALFEQFPEFDDLDDDFVENEEQITAMIAVYVDEHLDNFAEIEK